MPWTFGILLFQLTILLHLPCCTNLLQSQICTKPKSNFISFSVKTFAPIESCTTVLPRDLFFDRLTDYKIVIGDFKMLSSGDFGMPNKYEALRSLALQLTDDADIHSQEGIKLLFKRVENLLLWWVSQTCTVCCTCYCNVFGCITTGRSGGYGFVFSCITTGRSGGYGCEN